MAAEVAVRPGVESLSIIANKAQTKHFLESRLQENLGEPATSATPVSPDSAVQAGPAPADPPSAKMATHEPISPPPGFDDVVDDTAASGDGGGGGGGGGGELEGVEFEEFDMDWAPRRPVAPPMRSYMFGEQLGNKPASAPARPPASPSYRDLFTADEAASSTASVTSAVSLDEARQDSACGTSEPDETEESASGGAETMIAQEIRELRRREEELRRLREKTLAAPPAPEPLGEEPLSGYGSEERESFTEEPPCPSRLLPCDRAVSHQRSRSADSLSSGHSSSGLGSDTGDLLARRPVTVKPFEETDDDERWSYPRSAETPIEREIRLAKEREDERRREQAMFTSRHTMAAVFEEKPSTRTPGERPTPAPAATSAGLANDPREAALRLATGRVQEEIQEATRREIELRDEGKDITTSEETVDEKVTRLVDMTKHSVELTNDKKQRADQARSSPTAAKPSPGPKPAVKPVHIVPRPAPEPARPAAAAAAAPITVPAAAGGLRTDGTSRPVFRPAVTAGAGRGLMHKFIASRGRLRPVSVFSPAPSSAGARELSPPRSRRPAPPQLSVAAAARTEQTTERRGPVQVPSRRVLTAEAKIQLELQAMKEREEELRRHRSRMMAKSQPDLLAALGDMAPSQEEGDDDPAPGPLSRAMSNPNLLDDGPTETPIASANRRRRSTLIDQWESRIQGAEV